MCIGFYKINFFQLQVFLGIHLFWISVNVCAQDQTRFTSDTTLASSYQKKGIALYKEKQFQNATDFLKKSLSIYKKHNLYGHFVMVSGRLAAVYESSNEIDSGYQVLTKAKSFVEKGLVHDTLAIINLYKLYGAIYYRQDKFDSSFNATKKNISLIKKFVKDKTSILLADNYFNLANALSEFELLDEALDYYDSAAHIVRIIHGEYSEYMASIISNKSGIYVLMNNFEEAIELNEQSYRIKQKTLPPNDLAFIFYYYNTAYIFLERNEGEQDNLIALENLERCMEVYEKADSPDPYYLVYTYYAFVQAYKNLKKYDVANEYLQKVINLNIKMYGDDYEEKGYVLQIMGDIYLGKGELENARNALQSSIQFYKTYISTEIKALAESYELLGDLYSKQIKYKEALQSYQHAMYYFFPALDTSNFFMNPRLEDFYSEKHFLELLSKKALTLRKYYENEGNQEALAASLDTYLLLAQYVKLSRKGFYGGSHSTLEFAERTIRFYEEGIETALMLFKLSQDKSFLWKAFTLSDSRRYGLLLEELQQVRKRTYSNVPAEITSQEQTLTANINFIQHQLIELKSQPEEEKNVSQINILEDKIYQLKNVYTTLVKAVEIQYPAYYQMKFSDENLNIEQLTASLDVEDLLLEYFIGAKSLYLFMVSSKAANFIEIPKTEHFDDTIRVFLESLRTRDFKTYSSLAYALYEQFLKPVLENEKLVSKSFRHLIIIPDGVMGYIPFETLIQKPPIPGQGYKDLDYLLKDRLISYHYSASLLALKTPAHLQSTQKSFIGFAPSYSNPRDNPLALNDRAREFTPKLAALENTKDEVSSIADLMKGEAQTGENASEYNFKNLSGDYTIIHLAAHSLVEDEEPLLSKLVFDIGKDTVDDGLLHTYELYSMQLNADLACLSACNTGAGKLYQAEGIMSLGRGFAYAGVPNLLISLWAVPDRSTKDLMINFYRNIQDKNAYAEALRMAKLQYLQESDNITAAPYFWSAFVLIGHEDKDKNLPVWVVTMISILLLMLLAFAVYKLMNKRIKNHSSLDVLEN